MTWFWKSIGLGDDFITHLGEAAVDFHQWEALWIGLALLVPAAYFIYRRQERNLATVAFPLRLALTTTRVLVLALLVLVLAGPYLKFDQQAEKKPIVAVLFDHSQSMELPAGAYPDPDLLRIARAAGYPVSDGQLEPQTRAALPEKSRAKLVQEVVQNQAPNLLTPLAKKFDLQYYSVGADAVPLKVEAGKDAFPEPPGPRQTWAAQTHLGDAITHVLDEAAGRQVSGIVLFSDGQNTGGQSLAEAARATAAAGTPVFAVPAGAPGRQKDVAIVDVFATSLVSVGDTARVAVTVESHGFDKRKVKVQLREEGKVLDARDLVLRGTEQQRVELSFKAKQPGPHFLKVHIPPLDEEPEKLRANNTDDVFIRVGEDRLRVLYLEGLPRWDFRFLKNAMRRDHGLAGLRGEQPDILLEAEKRGRLPGSLEALARYHTVILGDVSPGLLTSEFLDLLVKAVREKGVGLVVEAGPLHMPHEFDQRLLELLPVRLLRRGGQPAPGLLSPDYKPFRLEVSPEGTVHEAMRFYDDPGRNLNAWRYMPPFYWCAAASRPSPAATVLAWNPNVQGRFGKLPLIAYHHAGRGKVLFVGTDSTWLWRQNVGDRYFYKFWGQALRFVARRDPAAAKKSWMEVRPFRAQPGERASVELMAFTDDGSPRSDRTLVVQLTGDKDQRPAPVRLLADPTVKGRYTGNFTLEEPGEYRVTYQPGGRGRPVAARVRVLESVEELRHPHVDRAALQRLADTTGGRLVELGDLETIPDKLKGDVKSSHLHREADLWDNWLVLSVLIFLYSLDVGLRRLAGLS